MQGSPYVQFLFEIFIDLLVEFAISKFRARGLSFDFCIYSSPRVNTPAKRETLWKNIDTLRLSESRSYDIKYNF